MSKGIRHLIECHCILAQMRRVNPIIFHKFVVFSVIGDDDQVIPKYAQCNNCGAIHKITEINTSEIDHKKEGAKSIMSKDDYRLTLPTKWVQVLDSYKSDLSIWEECNHILTETLWGKEIVISREEEGSKIQGKLLRIMGPDSVIIIPFDRNDEIEENS